MARTQKQYQDKNNKYSLKAILMEGKIAPTYKAILAAFVEIIQKNHELNATAVSPKILEATDIAVQVSNHFDYVELVSKEIMTLHDDYVISDFGLYINSNGSGNLYSCLSFKIKKGNGYYVQISRYIKQNKTGVGVYETKFKVGNNFETIVSDSILDIFDQIDNLTNSSKVVVVEDIKVHKDLDHVLVNSGPVIAVKL